MVATTREPEEITGGSPEEIKRRIMTRFAVRTHVALILTACFVAGLVTTKLLLMAGVDAMWARYLLALVVGYVVFLLGVRVWLLYAGFDRRILPSRRQQAVDGSSLGGIGWSGGGSGGGGGLPGVRGGGGGFGGGGASASFGDAVAPRGGGGTAVSGFGIAHSGSSGSSSGSSGGSGGGGGGGGGGGLDLGDGGWVLIALLALLAAVFGGVVWILYAAPTILADAAFAALLSAGLVRSTRHIASGGWIASVVGHTWVAFAAVFALALVFALVAQHQFPDARTMAEVVRRL